MLNDENIDEFRIWLNNGIERGWISDVQCATHEGIDPISEEEVKEWDESGDTCQFVVRIME